MCDHICDMLKINNKLLQLSKKKVATIITVHKLTNITVSKFFMEYYKKVYKVLEIFHLDPEGDIACSPCTCTTCDHILYVYLI